MPRGSPSTTTVDPATVQGVRYAFSGDIQPGATATVPVEVQQSDAVADLTQGTTVTNDARMAAPLFFANGSVFSDSVKRAVTATPGVRHVVLNVEAVTDIDVTGAEAFNSMKSWLAQRSVSLAYSRTRQAIVDWMRKPGLLGDETIYPTNRVALAALAEPGSTSA